MTDKFKAAILSPATLVPVGVLMVLILPLIGGTWTAAWQFSRFSARLESIENFVKKDSWTVSEEKYVWAQAKIDNPDIKIPNVSLIHLEALK